MPSYIDPETGKRVNSRYHKPPVVKGKPLNPPRSAGSYQDPETGEWKTLRRPKPQIAPPSPKPAAPTEPENPQSKRPDETPSHWYWRTHGRR